MKVHQEKIAPPGRDGTREIVNDGVWLIRYSDILHVDDDIGATRSLQWSNGGLVPLFAWPLVFCSPLCDPVLTKSRLIHWKSLTTSRSNDFSKSFFGHYSGGDL